MAVIEQEKPAWVTEMERQKAQPMSATAANLPAYGSNITNFDSTNPQHIALADAGQKYAQAKQSGDTAGMSAAAALGDQIRASMPGSTFDSTKGVSTLQNPSIAPMSAGTANTNPIYGGFTVDQLKQESAFQVEQDRLAKQRAMETALALLDKSKTRLFQNINEDRTLQNVQMDNTLSPFSGKSDYARGVIGMQRERSDREINEDYASKAGQAMQGYTDFLGTLSEQERQMYTDLLRRERDYGLQYGGLMGNLPNGGPQTLASKEFDWNKQMDITNQTGYLPNGQQTLAGKQFDAQQAQQQWDNAFKEKSFDLEKASQLWEQTFKEKSFDQGVKQFAQSIGLDWAKLNQNQQQFIAEQAFREKSLEMSKGDSTLSQDQVNRYNNLLDAYTSGSRSPQEALDFALSPQGKKNAIDYGLTEGLYNQMVSALKSKVPQVDSQRLYNDFLQSDLKRIKEDEVDAYVNGLRSQGVDEATIQKIIKDVSDKFKKQF